jgi:hypothetical protein
MDIIIIISIITYYILPNILCDSGKVRIVKESCERIQENREK